MRDNHLNRAAISRMVLILSFRCGSCGCIMAKRLGPAPISVMPRFAARSMRSMRLSANTAQLPILPGLGRFTVRCSGAGNPMRWIPDTFLPRHEPGNGVSWTSAAEPGVMRYNDPTASRHAYTAASQTQLANLTQPGGVFPSDKFLNVWVVTAIRFGGAVNPVIVRV